MSVIVESPESRFSPPEGGEYVAKLKEVEDLGEQPDPYNEGRMKRRVKLVWELPNGSTQWDWMTASLHPQATLYEVASFLLRSNPPQKLNLDTLIGKSCRLIIKQFTGNDGKTRSKVDGYLMVPATKSQPQARPASKPQPQAKPQTDPVEITDEDLPF